MDDKKTSKSNSSQQTRKKLLIGIPLILVALFIGANLLGIISDAPLTQPDSDDDSTPLVLNGQSKKSSTFEQEQKILDMKTLPVNIAVDKAVEVWKVNRGYTILTSPNTPAKNDTELNVITSKETPLYQSAGHDFYISYDAGKAIAVRSFSANASTIPTEKDKDFRSTVATTYLGYGLQKVQARNKMTDMYTGKGLVCTVTAAAVRSSVTVARCGAIAEYEKLATQIAPIATLLPRTSNPRAFKDIAIATAPNGSQRATMTVGTLNTSDTTSVTFQKASKTAPWKWLK